MSRKSLRLIGKPDCGLCDEMKRAVAPVAQDFGLPVDDIDVRADPQLFERYAEHIPVLLFGEAEIARHWATSANVRARLLELLDR